MLKFVVALVCGVTASVAAAQDVDLNAVNRILDEGMNRGEVMEIAAHLTDRIGGRMTNSPQMREAERWTQSKFRDWGLKNVTAEAFEFGRGWSVEQSVVRMVAPRKLTLRAIPVAWTPATLGTIRSEIIVAPLANVRDFEAWKGKLRGKIVLVTRPNAAPDPDKPMFERLNDAQLGALDVHQPPRHAKVDGGEFVKFVELSAKLDAFLASEGALAWMRMSKRDGGLLHGDGYLHKVGATPKVPGFELAAEDYRRLARLAKGAAPVTVEALSAVRFHDDDVNAYNILADIPGRDPKAGYVMAGAHLDSWAAGDGAADNAAGSAVVMEAARILSTLQVKPKRTIRFALWSGEEQGIYGSLNYVERRMAERGPPGDTDPWRRQYGVWEQKYPIRPKPGLRDLAAYFNLDGGSGKIRGIYAENNAGVVSIFREWFAPFTSMGASTVAIQKTGASDHYYMQALGAPAFQFIQDPLDYHSRLHHTGIDTYEHLRPDDLRQAAVIVASFLLFASNRDEPLPAAPLPAPPRPTDPFDHPVAEED